MDLNNIATTLYDIHSDFDHGDYSENYDEDLQLLVEELQKVEDNNCNALMQILEHIASCGIF